MEEVKFTDLPLLYQLLLLALGGSITMLLSIITWMAKKVDKRLDDINKSLTKFDMDLRGQVSIVRDELRERYNDMDHRVTKLEVRCDHEHGRAT